MNSVKLLIILFFVFIVGCKSRTEEKTAKYQRHREEIINVEDKLINIESEIIFGNSMLYIIDDFLIVEEIKPSKEKGIHLFDKTTFKHVASTGILGHGPGEIVRYGRIGIDARHGVFWVPDHGKKVMLKFPLDSILKNDTYKPTEGLELKNEIFLERFSFLNDSIALGKAVQIQGSNNFEMTMAKLNLKDNKTVQYGYEHPEASGKKSNSLFKMSVEDNIYVNSYFYCDLMTICDLEGNLKYNIYGPDELDNENFKKIYFTGIDLIDSNLIASYVGDVAVVTNEFKRQEGNLPTKFLIFDVDGNYKNTIETGHKFSFFCVDETNKRVIAYFAGRTNPLAYFNFSLNSK